MAYQLEFSEERELRELADRKILGEGAAAALRRAYDALNELAVGSNVAVSQLLEQSARLYSNAFQAYVRGDAQTAESQARAVRHLCRAGWFDAKIKHLESHADDLPHVPGLNTEPARMEQDAKALLSRLESVAWVETAGHYSHRAQKHLERLRAMSEQQCLLADAYLKAAFEYVLAAEALQGLEARVAA